MSGARLCSDWLAPFGLVSVTYLLAFIVTIYWLLPMQAVYTPDLAAYASLLFLPHGVRVLAAWLLGWRSVLLIAPVSLGTHWLNFGADGFSLAGVAGAMSGVVCAALAFWLLAKMGLDFRHSSGREVNWRDVIIAGSIASAVNTIGMGVVFGHNFATMSGYLIGDVSGLFACLLILMLAFKLLRSLGRP